LHLGSLVFAALFVLLPIPKILSDVLYLFPQGIFGLWLSGKKGISPLTGGGSGSDINKVKPAIEFKCALSSGRFWFSLQRFLLHRRGIKTIKTSATY
jgi:hypothetical protein